MIKFIAQRLWCVVFGHAERLYRHPCGDHIICVRCGAWRRD